MELNKVYQGNALEILRSWPDDFVDTIITSPPYWGLRDYGEEVNLVWGKKDCNHEWGEEMKVSSRHKAGEKNPGKEGWYKDKGGISASGGKFCQKCGAWYGQLGLEPTLEMYLDHLLLIVTELRRILKPTGVMFWNHGDCYFSKPKSNYVPSGLQSKNYGVGQFIEQGYRKRGKIYRDARKAGMQDKCLVLQNYRLVLRMIDDQGWILRNTIIWHKPNVMPSSVKDRFVVSYEPVFMLVKEKKYWFDQDAIRVPYDKPLDRWAGEKLKAKGKSSWGEGTGQEIYRDRDMRPNKVGRNPRDVWRLPTRPKPFKGIHFAVFPEKLVEPMIKATCPEFICKKCGKARERITKPTKEYAKRLGKSWHNHSRDREVGGSQKPDGGVTASYQTVGWTDCGCNAGWRPGIVFDPFMGSGTVAVVANQLRRDWLGVELSPKFVKLIKKRVRENPKPMV